MFVDSHCHLEMEDFEKDRRDVIARSLGEGIDRILTVATEERYFCKVVDIIEQNPTLWGAIGIHPHNASEYNKELAKTIAKHLKHEKIVGYGEIGLDFFKNYSPRESQIHAFRLQLEAAKDAGLPVIIHSRNAKEETIQILSECWDGALGGVIHCYSYDLHAAKRFLDMNFTISIPGTITYPNAHVLEDVVKHLPGERILAETDAPFLTPHPYRGKRNEPCFVKLTIERIAHIRGEKIEALAGQLGQNFEKLFLLRKAAQEDGPPGQ